MVKNVIARRHALSVSGSNDIWQNLVLLSRTYRNLADCILSSVINSGVPRIVQWGLRGTLPKALRTRDNKRPWQYEEEWGGLSFSPANWGVCRSVWD